MSLSAFKKAVVDTPDPTPGYLYRDIAKGTVDPKECAKLVEAIVKKLQKSKSPHELRKTNQVIKSVCEQGGGTFKKDMQEKVEIMRAVAQYRGTPDPVHGDSINEKVRSTGKEAIDAVFRSARTEKANLDISGQGANTVEKGKEQTFVTGTAAAGGIGGNAGSGTGGAAGGQGAKSTTMLGQISNAVDTRFGLRPTTERDVFMKQVAEGSHNASETYTPAAVVGGFEPATIGGPAPVAAPPVEQGFVAPEAVVQEEEVSEELKLVQKLMKVKTNPTRGQLNTFVQEASEMDIQAVCGHLDDALCEKQHWQQRLKALFAVEAMLAAEVPAAKHYYQKYPEDIVRNSKVVQETLKKKALKVAQMLDLSGAIAPPAVAPATVNADLFNQLENSPPAQPPAAPTASTTGDMFEGMVSTPNNPGIVPIVPLPAPTPEAEAPSVTKKKKKRGAVKHEMPELKGPIKFGGGGEATPSPPPGPVAEMGHGHGSVEAEIDTLGANPSPPATTTAPPMPMVPPVQPPAPPAASPDMPDIFQAPAPPLAPPQPAAPAPAPAPPAKAGAPNLDDLFAADPTPFNGSAPAGTPTPTPGIGAPPIMPQGGAFAPVAPQTAPPAAGLPGMPAAAAGGMPGPMTPAQQMQMMQMMQMMMAGGAAGGFPGMQGMVPPGAPTAPPQPTKADTAFGDLCNAAKDGLKGK